MLDLLDALREVSRDGRLPEPEFAPARPGEVQPQLPRRHPGPRTSSGGSRRSSCARGCGGSWPACSRLLRRLQFRRRALTLPLPPPEMRDLIGGHGPEEFEPPAEGPVLPGIESDRYEFVLDFGCGCGRIARQLALAARPMPGRYLGIDHHAGMVRWAGENLTSRLPNFSFAHHAVYDLGFNPDPALPRMAPLPVRDGEVTLMLAISVFTHLVQDQAEYYLDEVARVLAPKGVLYVSFFLFDRALFPMLQAFQAALYINHQDPTNAVIYDRAWLFEQLDRRGLRVRSAEPPVIRGFQWHLHVERGRGSIELPADEAPIGRRPPPVCETPAHLIGGEG